jgi:predicted nucleic acid-binding protein
MILVDTSVIVAWLDPAHSEHAACEAALIRWGGQEVLAVSAITYAELAAGGRTREAVDEVLTNFERIDLSFNAAFRAGQAFGRWNPGKHEKAIVQKDEGTARLTS